MYILVYMIEEKKNNLCSICGKKYSSRQSLHNHKKRMHPEKDTTFPTFSNQNTTQIQPEIQHNTTNIQHTCKYCNKVFSFSQSKYRHQKKCKYNTDVNYISKDEHLEELQKIKEKQAEELHQLKEELTAQFTKMLNEKNVGNTNNNTMKIGDHNTDIGTQNNFTIIQLGKEDVLGTITQKEKLKILNERYKSVLELVKLMHCSGKYPQFNNTIINNLKSPFALTYNDEEDQFVTTNKDDLVSDIVSYRTTNVEEILEENKGKVSIQTDKKVKELIEILEKDDLNIMEEDIDFAKKYTTKVMTSIYDKRKEIKQKLRSKIDEMK